MIMGVKNFRGVGEVRLKMFRISESSTEKLPILFNSYSHDDAEHIHDYIELVYVFSGSGIHHVDGVKYALKKGCLLYIDYGQVHSFTALENMSYVNFLIKPEYFSETIRGKKSIDDVFGLPELSDVPKANNTQMAYFEGKECADVEHLIFKMMEENHDCNQGFETIIKNDVMNLLIYMRRKLVTEIFLKKSAEIPPELQRVIEYIDKHSGEKITLKLMSEMCNYSQDYLSKLLKVHFGSNFSEYLIKKRVNSAVYILMTTDLSIFEVSQMAGFTNKTHFYKMFKKYLGIKPSFIRAYKATCKNKVQFDIVNV